MSELSFLQIQAVQLRELLANAADDPILSPQLKDRLDDIEKKIDAAARAEGGGLFGSEPPSLPRAAVFLRGGGVQGSEGIRPALAGESLIQYERMFTEQALHDEREAARTAGRHRRPRGTPTPGLLFTGTPRGSFGLEFVPQQTSDSAIQGVHAQSLKNVANALVRIGKSNGSLDEVIRGIPPGVLRPMKRFMNALAEHGAELRLSFSDAPSQSLSIEQVKAASERLERDVIVEDVKLHGLFRGVTRESVWFDLVSDEIGLITGTVADEVTEEDLERIDSLTNKRCVARIQKTTVQRLSGSAPSSYLLLDANEDSDGDNQ